MIKISKSKVVQTKKDIVNDVFYVCDFMRFYLKLKATPKDNALYSCKV